MATPGNIDRSTPDTAAEAQPANSEQAARAQQIFIEQIASVCRGGLLGAASSGIVGGIYLAVQLPLGGQTALWVWFGLLNLFGAARVLLALYAKNPFNFATARRLAVIASVFALLTGLCWGAAASILFPFAHPEVHIIIAFIVVGLPTGALITCAAWWPASALYVIGAALPFCTYLLMLGDRIYMLSALTGAIYTLTLVSGGRALADIIRDNIGKRLEIAAMADGMKVALEAAQSANRAKSSFLANISHEIRTPLNAVIGMNELLMHTSLSADQRRCVESVREAGFSLLDILNSVIDVSRIEAGRLDLNQESFAVRTVIRGVESMFLPAAQRKGLALQFDVASDVPQLLVGDPVRWRQIVVNLIGNAIKFTDRGKVVVSLQLKQVNGRLCILRCAVTDTGIGIRREDQPLLFQLFSQVDSALTRRFGGAGMGLRISADLAALMGGEIGVESELACGSCFWFTAKMTIAESDTVMAVPGLRREVPAVVAGSAGARVLVVEDNAVNQTVITNMLSAFGCEVDIAGNGEQALAQIGNSRYDMVFMDCQMPVMDGYAATEELRRREAGSATRLPVIALTAHALAGDRERCLAAGMDDYLAKPYRRGQIVEMLQRWLPRPMSSAEAPRGNQAAVSEISAAADAVLDGESVVALRQLDQTRPGVMRELVGKYLDITPRHIRALREFDGGDVKSFKRYAHLVNGASAQMGALALADIAAEIEVSCQKDLSLAMAKVGRLEPEFEKVSAALQKLVA